MALIKDTLELDVSALVLSDIEDNVFNLSKIKGKNVVLVGAGREGAPEARKWGKFLSAECNNFDDVEYLRIAFVGKLPGFVPKSFIKSLLKSTSASSPPLIAWDNQPAELLGLSNPKTPHIFLIDKYNHLRLRFAGYYSQENLNSVIEELRKL